MLEKYIKIILKVLHQIIDKDTVVTEVVTEVEGEVV